MKSKLTLTIDKETKERAKLHARRMGKSVSELVEGYLDKITETEEWQPPENSVTAELSGSMPLPEDKSYDDLLTEALKKRQR